MARYRKKPVEIEAMQYPGPAHLAPIELLRFREWVHSHSRPGCVCDCRYVGNSLAIRTLEGTMLAAPGDWVIRGVVGELYPCKPDIFAKTYEKVD